MTAEQVPGIHRDAGHKDHADIHQDQGYPSKCLDHLTDVGCKVSGRNFFLQKRRHANLLPEKRTIRSTQQNPVLGRM